MCVIRPAVKNELRAALGALLARPDSTSDELHRQIDTLLRYTSKNKLSLEHCLVAENRGRISAACLSVDAPGRTSSVFIPNHLPTPAHADLVVVLLREAARQAKARGVQLLQGMTAPDDTDEQDLYRRAGFEHLTELIYLERDVTRPVERSLPSTPVIWEEYTPRVHAEFARVVQGTYEQSLDCAALNGVRSIEDALASHRSTGEFDPHCWLLARAGKEPVGTILMARIPERASMEVVYMGLLPYARGRGYGATLLRRAIEAARAHGAALVTLTVDVRNAPARKLYSAFGFSECGQRDVWMSIAPNPDLHLEPDSNLSS